MSTTLLVVLLPPALLVLQATLNVPQLVRLFRAQHEGVPLTGEALSLLGGAGWLVWSLLARDPAMALSAVLALVGFGPSTWILLRAGQPWRAAAGLTAVLSAGAVAGIAVGGFTALAGMLTALAIVQYGAYLTAAARCRDWSGFSPASGVLRILFGVGWGLYGHLRGTTVLVVWGVLTAVTFSITLTRALLWRRAHSASSGPRAGRSASQPWWTHLTSSGSPASSATRSS